MIAPLARRLLLASVLVTLCVAVLVAMADRTWVPPDAYPVGASTFESVVVDRVRLPVPQLDEIAERPLFAPSRRPPAPVAPVQAFEASEPIKDARVLGLFGSEGAWGVILSIEGKVRRVGPGEKIGAWALARVAGNEILFEREDGTSTTLKIVHLPQAAAPPAAKPTADAATGEGQQEAAGARPSPPEQKGQ